MDMLEGMRHFVRVVDAGGFAAAARKMGVTRSMVTKQVAKLETELGTQLLRRSTRQVSPTDTGVAFYQRCQAILAELESAVASVTELQDAPLGTLRVNAPMSFGTLHLGEIVASFMARYPGVRVELVLNDRMVDPLEEGFDVSVRICEPRFYTSLVTREYAPVRRVLCASKGYIDSHGEPTTPSELRDHQVLHYGYQATGIQWRLRGPAGEASVPVTCGMWSNNGDVLAAAACAERGIALLPTFIVGPALRSGRLVTLMDDFEPTPLTLCALYPRHRHLSSKLRLFVDWLGEAVGQQPYWDQPT